MGKKYEVIGKNEHGRICEYFIEDDLDDAMRLAGNLFDDCGYMYELDENEERVSSINIEETLLNGGECVIPSDIVYNW